MSADIATVAAIAGVSRHVIANLINKGHYTPRQTDLLMGQTRQYSFAETLELCAITELVRYGIRTEVACAHVAAADLEHRGSADGFVLWKERVADDALALDGPGIEHPSARAGAGLVSLGSVGATMRNREAFVTINLVAIERRIQLALAGHNG